MSNCKYSSNGVNNPVNTEILQYVEDVPSNERSSSFVENVLISNQIVKKVGDDLKLIPLGEYHVQSLNTASKTFFQVNTDLIVRIPNTDKVRVDEELLREMQFDPNVNSFTDNTEQTEDPNEPITPSAGNEEYNRRNEEVFQIKENLRNTTKHLILNLEKQILALERLPQGRKTKIEILKLKNLKQKLSKVEFQSVEADHYLDFIDYVTVLSRRAGALMDTIEANYVENFNSISAQEKAQMLNDLTVLNQTIDAFYLKDPKKSVMNKIQEEFQELRDQNPEKIDKLIVDVVNSIEEMKDVKERFLDVGIPILGDYLYSLADDGVNKKIDETIEKIKATNTLIGINRYDNKFKLAKKQAKELNSIAPLVELNILQLQNKKIGRNAIIKELRERSDDASGWSAYTDPIMYSSKATAQLFATTVTAKNQESREKTIKTVNKVAEAFNKFLETTEKKDIDPKKLYENMVETIEIRVKENDAYVTKKALSIVQKYNVSEYNKSFNNAIKALRFKHNYPETNTYDALEAFYKSADGKLYQEGKRKWYEENSSPKGGRQAAQAYVIEVVTKMEEARRALLEADQRGLSQEDIDYYKDEFFAQKREYDSVKKGNTFIGKLTVPNEKYLNPKYQNMPAAEREYLDVLQEVYEEHQAKLGSTRGGLYKNSWDEFSAILPSIKNEGLERFQREGFKSFTDSIKDGFQIQATDTEFGSMLDSQGERIKSIPIYYTNLVNPEDVSYDITNSILMFADMANRFESKGEILGVVNMMHLAAQEQEVYVLESTGNKLLDRISKKLGFKEFAQVEDAKNTFYYKQLESFIDAVYYGERVKRDTKSMVGSVNSAKATGSVAKLTALANLSFNFLQIPNQYIMDTTAAKQEAWGGEFYNTKHLRKARTRLYLQGFGTKSALLGAVKDATNPTIDKRSKLAQAHLMFDVMQKGSGSFANLSASRTKKYLTTDTLMSPQEAVEFITSSEKFLALAASYEGKLKDSDGNVIKNKNGKNADLWDLLIFDSKNKLIVDPRVTNFDKNDFVNKFHALVTKTNQLKGESNTVLGERIPFVNLLYLFKKYFMPNIRKRYGAAGGGFGVNYATGVAGEGYYQGPFNLLMSSMWQFKTNGAKGALKTFSNLTSDQKAQLKRLAYERIVLLVTAFITMMLGSEDDDKKENTALENHLLYQALRLNTEYEAFSNPLEFIRITVNPMASSSLFADWYQLLISSIQLGGYTVGLVPEEVVKYQKSSGQFEKGDFKITKRFYELVPGLSGLLKSSTPEESVKFFQLNK